MTTSNKTGPSRGRLFKLFTDLGPYFRKQQSTDSTFFFDCLEICVDDKKEPDQRQFLGWWILLTKSDKGFSYERFNGLYNLAGDWVSETIDAEQQTQLDASFELFIVRLASLIEVETGHKLITSEEVSLIEA